MAALRGVQCDSGGARRKVRAPAGLQQVLNLIARVALTNNPCCYYDCFASALEADLDKRTLLQLQWGPCKSTIVFYLHIHKPVCFIYCL
jgi:hypothetical protein